MNELTNEFIKEYKVLMSFLKTCIRLALVIKSISCYKSIGEIKQGYDAINILKTIEFYKCVNS